MIIPNGTIEFIKNTAGGVDENGYPVASSASYSKPIPCQFMANTHSFLGKSNGEAFIKASYTILIEALSCVCKTELLRLKDCCGNVIKEKASVLEFEPLRAVCQLRIII